MPKITTQPATRSSTLTKNGVDILSGKIHPNAKDAVGARDAEGEIMCVVSHLAARNPERADSSTKQFPHTLALPLLARKQP